VASAITTPRGSEIADGRRDSHPSRSEERFRLLVESVKDDAIFMLDPSGHISTWNAGAERIKGYAAHEIIGKHFSCFYLPEAIAAGKCEHEFEVATREGRFEEEGWRLRKDGSRFWASVTITALREKDGTLIGFAKVTRDLTERRAAEEEVRRFRLLVESVKDYAIFMLDPSGHISTWNAGAERIKGYAAHEIIGKHFSAFYPPEAIASGKCELELELASREGRFEEEGWRLRKCGSRFWASVTITALRNGEGTLVGFAKVTRDLTERRQAEEQRRALAVRTAALEEKARIQEFQERFLAILGHDLRNPLASIDMGAGLLRQREKDPVAVRILQRMHTSSRRMSRMIEQILDLTRSRLAGGLQMNCAAMDLHETLRAIVDELRAAHPSRTIELRSSSVRGVWDADRLEQLLSNLISNAIVHGNSGKPVGIDVRVGNEAVQVEVHNHGPPISERLQATLFNPFRRGERESRSTKTEGLGLGLYISREIAVAHGGSIDFRSTSTDGTTFTVTLPFVSDARPSQ
jgi:PAS domain S-box-containing protein